jgi:hypothetical protein
MKSKRPKNAKQAWELEILKGIAGGRARLVSKRDWQDLRNDVAKRREQKPARCP